MNRNPKDFKRHSSFHDLYNEDTSRWKCDQCHTEFSPFTHARPDECFKKHKKSHDDFESTQMKGQTKVLKEYPCRVESCRYSFRILNERNKHENQHEIVFKCDLLNDDGSNCNKVYDAFTSQYPAARLQNHKSICHSVKSLNCDLCGAWFQDVFSKNTNCLTCSEQVSIHKKFNCFNFKTPVNYLWFAMPESDFCPLNSFMVCYPGESEKSFFRAFDQIEKLVANHKKKDDKDKYLDEIYNLTLGGNGLYLMLINNEKSINFENLKVNHQTARTSEFSEIKEERSIGNPFLYNRSDGTNPLKINAKELNVFIKTNQKLIDKNLKTKCYLKFNEKDTDYLIKNFKDSTNSGFTQVALKDKKTLEGILNYLSQLDERYKTNFFKKRVVEEDSNIEFLNLKLNMLELQKVLLGQIKDKKEQSRILSNWNLSIKM